MTSADMQLTQRLTAALGGHDVDPNVKDRIQRAYLEVDGTGLGFDGLPQDIQDAVKEIEASPAQSWEDPSEVPDDIYES